MHQRRSSPSPRGESFGEHRHDGIEIRPRERAIRPRASHERKEIVFAALARRYLRGNLLREDVKRAVLRDDAIELAATHRAEERGAFDQVIARLGQQASLGRTADRVTRAADALEQRRDPVRRSDLADEIDVTDVDAELERRGRDERLQRAALQPMLGVEANLLRQAAVMRGHGLLAEPLAQMPRSTLGHLARIDEDQRRLVLRDQLREAVGDAPRR